jgi:hypothetical protein
VRILPDIPQEDETILRRLFKKFSNSWSLFQKHSRLERQYSVQNLKTLKAKVERVEALFRDQEKQKSVLRGYKELKKENFVFKNREEELRRLVAILDDQDLDKYTLRIFLSERYPAEEKKTVVSADSSTLF